MRLLPVELRLRLITRSKISYSLIEPQPLPSTPVCGCQFHVLAVHLLPHQKKITTPLFGSAFGIWLEVCGGAIFPKTVNVLSPVAAFAEELRRWCLTKFQVWFCLRSFSPLGLHKGILNSHCLLIILIHTKHKNNKMKSWTDPMSSFPLRRTHPLDR